MRHQNLIYTVIAITTILAISVGFDVTVHAATPVLKWSKTIPSVVRESSPMPVQLSGSNGRTDVMFGAHDGKLYILNSATGDYAANWPQQTDRAINATPSSADIGSGNVRIYTGTGVADGGQCSGGSLWSYNVTGSSLFSFRAPDNVGGSGSQCQYPAIHSSPVIGDINNDNIPDVSFGALSLKAWSIRFDGGVNRGWPYYWDDTQFATPALADIDGNGVTDVVMAGDSSPGAPIDFRGGMVKAMRGNGTVIWEYRINEIVRSSPVIGDIDGDGQPEVVFGAGNYWAQQSGGASDATKLFVLNARTGQLKWSRDLGGQTLAVPTLADFDGDGVRDIAIGTWDGPNPGRVFLLKGNNTLMNGYPRASSGGIVIGQISTADLNGDGKQDIIVPTGGGVYAYSGLTGAQLWGLKQGQTSYQNTPLVQDIDGNGRLDIFLAGGTGSQGTIDRYEFQTAGEASVGTNGMRMFHGDTRLTGNVTPPPLRQNVEVPAGNAGQGYVIASDTGKANTYGSTPDNGSLSVKPAQPIVGVANVPDRNGYWMVASDGGIFSFGDAAFHGSTGAIRLNKPIVGMAPTPSGNGYWMVASDGGIFSFGDAAFHGSTGAIRLNKPIVGMSPTDSGNGYWLVASDGGIFAFGDAPFRGSTGAIRLNQPITSIMRAPGNGYWMVAKDGGIFSFGAPFYGAGSSGGSVVGASVQADRY